MKHGFGCSTNLKVFIQTWDDGINALDKEVEDSIQLVVFGFHEVLEVNAEKQCHDSLGN